MTRAESPITEAETDGLPGPIVTDLLEAGACCAFGAYRAAALVARRAVEQVVVMRRVPLEMRTLHQKMVWLLTSGHLSRAHARHARTVADIGTAAAHGGEPMTSDEAHAMVVSSLAVARAVLLVPED
ncbi:MAG: DUF4145 domain-containing protein [Acidimicrobiales bacterium]